MIRLLVLMALLLPTVGSAAKPGPSNTGPNNPGIITPYTGDDDITVDGTTLENFSHNGQLNIMADNVTIRNCIIDGGYNGNAAGDNGSIYGILAHLGGHNLLVEYCEIRNVRKTAVSTQGNKANDIIIRYNHIHTIGSDGIKNRGGETYIGNWVERIGFKADSHADSVQMRKGTAPTLFQGNYMDAEFGNPLCVHPISGRQCKGSTPFIIQAKEGDINNLTLEGNWLSGGNQAIYSSETEEDGFSSGPNVVYHNNYFPLDPQPPFGANNAGSGAGKSTRYGDISGDGGHYLSCNRKEADLSFLPNQNSTTGCASPPDIIGGGTGGASSGPAAPVQLLE